MLNICTPPPDIYSMMACMGRDLAGEIASSHARLFFSFCCDASAAAEDDGRIGALPLQQCKLRHWTTKLADVPAMSKQ